MKADPNFGFDMVKDISVHSTENDNTTKRIVRCVKDAYCGKEKSPFSTAEIEDELLLHCACKCYFKSLRDAERIKEKGTLHKHAEVSRRQSRRREVRRLAWQKKRLRKAKELLEEEYKKKLPAHLKGNKRVRVIIEIPTNRKPPSNCPSWILRSSWRDSADEEEEDEHVEMS